MVCDRVSTQVQLLSDGRRAGMTLTGPAVGMPQQVDLDRDGTSGEIKLQQFVGNGETVFHVFPADGRFRSSHAWPPPFVCFSTH